MARQAWGENRLAALQADSESGKSEQRTGEPANQGHAYLGYTNLALSMLRLHQPNNQFANLNDTLTASLLQGLIAAPYGLLETYPNETYPADIAAVIGSIALHDKATGENHQRELATLVQHFCDQFVDAKTGLVFQSVDAVSGLPVDRPRASGSALSAYYLSFVDNAVAVHLFEEMASSQVMRLPVGSAIKEYPQGENGEGDIDSGLLVLGASPSATAFAIGGARLTDSQALYQDLYKTILLFSDSARSSSASSSDNGSVSSAVGDASETPLSRSILLAMLTAGS